MDQSLPAQSVYRPSLAKLLTVHGLLCFVAIGFYTLPVALLRRLKTRLVVSSTMLSYQSGVASVSRNDIPIVRVDNVAVERSVWDQVFGCGTLVVSAGGGEPTRCNVGHIERALADVEARVRAAHHVA